MPLTSEIDKIRDSIREIEDPAVAMALRHVCKALEEIREQASASEQEPPSLERRPQ